MLSFTMVSNFSCHQFKTNSYIKVVIGKPHDNHKAKTHSRYTKNKEKGIQVYHQRKSNHKEQAKKKQRGTIKKKSQKTVIWQ